MSAGCTLLLWWGHVYCYSTLVGRVSTWLAVRPSSGTRLSRISVGVHTGANRLGGKFQNGTCQRWH